MMTARTPKRTVKPTPKGRPAMPIATIWTGGEVTAWLAYLRMIGSAQTDAEAAELLGISPATIARMKKIGATKFAALACTALAADLPIWSPPIDR